MALQSKLRTIGLILSSSLLVSSVLQPKPIPHYQEIIDAQFGCDKNKFNRFGFDPSRGFKLAPKAWSVISGLKIEEIKPLEKPAPNRRFDISFRGISYFECGQTVKGIDTIDGIVINNKATLGNRYNKPQYIDFIKDPTYDSSFEGWALFLQNDRTTDVISPSDTMGFTCLVTLDQFLKNSNSIDLDKLCAGESKEKREFTKKEIAKAIEILKKRNPLMKTKF